MFWAAASPAGLAAASQNTTNSHLETLRIELVLYHFEAKAFLM
jgi:hypothetical protein